MTKKHFNALAEAIREIARAEERKRAAETVAEVCRRFNGRFDAGRFFRACNVNC
jgi:hypothetical protein